ncbi:MAG: DUF3025 domain-containing protein [Algicola sp.]|nr:DUF3025 domain-containing protein [Algicola sp.]
MINDPSRNKSVKKKVFQAFEHWTTQFTQDTGFFDHPNVLFAFEQWPDFPAVEILNSFLPEQTTTSSGHPIIFVAQDENFDFGGKAYETIIYQTGQVPTRQNSWHDTFGALIWCLFPKTKALLNKLHQQDIIEFGLKARTKTRNAITLLDECGVIMAISDQQFQCQLRDHQWHWAFIKQREQWDKTVKPFIFGHANYEMLTKPYIGLTGKALFVTVDAGFFSLSLAQQYQHLDSQLVEMIGEQQMLKDNQHLSPLPLLGIPGWYPDNEKTSFYDNKQYFRDKRIN